MKQAGVSKIRIAALCAAAGLCLSAMPSAGYALGLIDKDSQLLSFTPASIDPRLAELVAQRGADARIMRFTPAGSGVRGNRSVTVAVRVDADAARIMTVHSATRVAAEQVSGEAKEGLASTRYNLGIARGYKGFVRPQAPVLSGTLSDARIPDLAEFLPTPARQSDGGRFSTRITMEEDAKTGAAPRTLDSRSDQRVELGGSYRLTRNLDVTAGVRYSQERDRLAPLADPAKQDSQAIYVGTQFRF